MIKVTTHVPYNQIREAFLAGTLELDETEIEPEVQSELTEYLIDLEHERQNTQRKENDHGTDIRMQNNKVGQRNPSYQRLRVQRRLQPYSGG